jgi:hypothetical protein
MRSVGIQLPFPFLLHLKICVFAILSSLLLFVFQYTQLNYEFVLSAVEPKQKNSGNTLRFEI